jgi:putative phosphoesterase
MKVGLLSDTHGFLDDAVLSHFGGCDEIWHAGDVGAVEVLDRLGAVKQVRAVYGNVDGADVRACVREDLEWFVEGVRVYMTHIGGYPGRYDTRAKREIERRKPDLFICGHSHIVRVMRDAKLNLLHLNPGASGHSGWHTMRTAMRFSIARGKVEDVELIELGRRGQKGG